MEILTNPVTISVIVLCVLSLLKLNVLLAMLIACVVGGLVGGMDHSYHHGHPDRWILR